MNEQLKIETILGYVANDNPLRASRDGKAFEAMLPAPAWTEQKVKRNVTVKDTVTEMKRIIKGYDWQTLKLAKQLRDKDLYSTCKNIWNFLYTHIKYKEDDEGQEQLRTPSRSFAQRLSRGIDCDDFSIFAGCILHILNIPFYIRIARYEGKDYFQHVYLVVPKNNKDYIVIDAVLDEYDSEKTPIETKDFLVMNTNNLNGIDISVLGGIEDDTINEISGILSGADFKELEGLGATATKEQELEAIRKHLIRTRNSIAQRPDLIRSISHPDNMLSMIDYALKYWDTENRDTALSVLMDAEEKINNSEGVRGVREDFENVELLFGLNTTGSYDVLGKLKTPVKFFTQVKQAVQNVGQGIKSVVQNVVKYNPVTVGIRGAVLLALKLNLLKVSTQLKWGYLTEAEARSSGFDINEWQKLRSQLTKAERLFVETLQGQAENFKDAILNGRAGNLSGFDLGLGVVAVAAAGASTAAAMPFILKLQEFLKNVDFKKLLEKVNAKRLAKEPKEAETTSTLPVNQNSPSVDASSFDEGYGANLPTTTNNAKQASKDANSPTGEENFLDKAIAWVKENPVPVAVGTGIAGYLLYQVLKPKKGLSGVKRKGKKKKGKAKKNPPQVITGVRNKKRKPKAKLNSKKHKRTKTRSREVRL